MTNLNSGSYIYIVLDWTSTKLVLRSISINISIQNSIRVKVFDATFNNISVISWPLVLLVEETGQHHGPTASNWQTLSHNALSCTHRHERDSHNFSGDRH